MHGLNWVDYIIITIIVLSMIISVLRGFVREVLSVFAWILAIWIAMTFASDLAESFNPYVHNAMTRLGLAFFVLFVISLVVAALVNFLIVRMVAKIGLGSIDKCMGLFFGFARGVVLVALILACASLTVMPKQKYWQETYLLPYFNPLEQWMLQYLPTNIGAKLAELSDSTEVQHGKILIAGNK
jgi:membrane protein required for colicin V production